MLLDHERRFARALRVHATGRLGRRPEVTLLAIEFEPHRGVGCSSFRPDSIVDGPSILVAPGDKRQGLNAENGVGEAPTAG
jgi:hypothetical protein